MDKKLKLVILEGEAAPKDLRLGPRTDKSRALNALASSGAKVLHDSGGRFVVIEESPNTEDILKERLVNARLVPVDKDVKDSIPDLDPTELLFLEALKIRTSKSYRDAKKRRKVGETPEEKELLSAPCIREEY